MIDKIICLSLSRRQDRLVKLKQSAPDLPEFEIFEALTPTSFIVPGSWKERHSYYSTTKGHLMIMEKLWKDEDWNNVLILEDDAEFNTTYKEVQLFVDKVNTKRPDWLGIFLGYHNQREATPVDGIIELCNGCTMSHAYVINRPGLERLYDHLWVCQFRIVDWAYSDLMKDDKAFFIPKYQMITTQKGFSENMFHEKQRGT